MEPMERGEDSPSQHSRQARHGESLLRQLCTQPDQSTRAELLELLSRSVEEDASLLSHLAKSLQRLAADSPLRDVQEGCLKIVRMGDLPEPRLDPPSYFMPSTSFPSYNSPAMSSEARAVFEELLLHSGRVPSNVERVIGTHPVFLKSFYMAYTNLLWEPGPLLMQWRPYILAMGAAQHSCHYLVEIYENMFLEAGGDARWLTSLENTPVKLQRLLPVTQLLAHRPWYLSHEHIRVLVQGEEGDEGGAVWSVGELAQAIALATTSQFLASFVWGCGVSPEMVGGGEEGRSSTPESSRAAGASESPGCTLIEGDEETTRVVEKLKRGVSCWKSDEVDMLEEFKKAGEVVESITEGESEVEKAGGVAEDLMRYLKTSRGVEIVQHEDFSVHSKDYDIFHVEEYNWEDNAVPQLDRFI